MNQYRVRVTRQAKKQLQSIKSYISFHLLSPDTANNLIKVLHDEMKKLSEMPGRIRLVDEQPWKSYGIRKRKVSNYYIYFWINEEAKKVQIIAVIYAKMNQTEQLKKLDFKEL